MRKVVISVDSTCDLSPEVKEAYGLQNYPFHIIFRGEDYIDNETITPADIFAGYREDGSLPKTAAINELEYLKHFRQLVSQDYEVVHISLAAPLSSAYQNACSAAKIVGHTYVVDSQNLSCGMGYLAITGARLAMKGMNARKIAKHLNGMRERIHVSFVMDTFEFLAAGGRCPQALAYVGKMMKIKPEILVDPSTGKMSIGRLYRGKMQRVLPRYVNDNLDRYAGQKIDCEDMFVSSADMDSDLVELVCMEIRNRLPIKNFHISEVSCCVASHCGPGTLGFLVVTNK